MRPRKKVQTKITKTTRIFTQRPTAIVPTNNKKNLYEEEHHFHPFFTDAECLSNNIFINSLQDLHQCPTTTGTTLIQLKLF